MCTKEQKLVKGKFYPDEDLMGQLSLLDNEADAKKWWGEYVKFHGTKDTGIRYVIGYFPITKMNELYKWFDIK